MKIKYINGEEIPIEEETGIQRLELRKDENKIYITIIKNIEYNLNKSELLDEAFKLINENTPNKKYNKEIRDIFIGFYKNYNYKDYLDKIEWNKNFTFPFTFNDKNYKDFKSPADLIFNFKN